MRFLRTAVVATLAILIVTPAAFAAFFQVESTKDLPDAQIDGVCATLEGTCTLRAAIQEANATTTEDIVNVLPGKYALKLVGANEDAAATGDLDVLQPLVINAAGPDRASIAGKKDRAFEVFPGASLTMQGLTIRKGEVGKKGLLGSAFNGGGILNHGTLTLTNCVVTGNKASDDGGGIGNDAGTLTLSNTTVSKNKAGDDAGGIDNDGGTAGLGGCNVSKNKAGDEAGGIESDDGELTLDAVTIDGNSAKEDGGGVNVEEDSVLTATNVTFSKNKGGEGGGLLVSLSTATLVNVTLKGNKSKDPGAAIANQGGTVTITNTLLDGNKKVTCAGTIASGGGNVEDTTTCGLGVGEVSGVKKLGVAGLKLNNAGTFTHALKPGSVAIDAGVDAACPTTDQRLLSRLVDVPGTGTTTCDAGAFELQLDELD